MLKKEAKPDWKCKHLIAMCQDLTLRIGHVRLSHMGREGNNVVEKLASLGPFFNHLKIWTNLHDIPDVVRATILGDIRPHDEA